jgi:hypothetical protein
MFWNKVCFVVSFFGITSILSGSGGGKAICRFPATLGKALSLCISTQKDQKEL